ncbi:hypothetical protein N865_16375 [Intrasporangium oryzae NRRL B-24470]|uniref:Thiamine biosynthesis protein ThiF n=1 Tax=Intrasporangium oryzae NRRL B-24470 TaxID=1386089 RepID=W9G688_9MICO|nr:hypothetical protein [Intrasporangium oryzae]EWT00323.1 hypothetical protein N865_16375 [Intrasporangium oryzae NRRL B-24470]
MSSPAPESRPRFAAWLRPVARRPGEVQFGVLPDGPIVTGLTAAETDLLALLDGSRPVSSTYRDAARAGVPARRWRELLELVARLGVLESPPPEPSSATVRTLPGVAGPPSTPRAADVDGAARHVVVDGDGGLVDDIVTLVRRGGVGEITHGRQAVDHVIADPRTNRPDLVVLVGPVAIDPRRGDVWLGHGVPHLPVVPSGARVTVGPLVDPGTGPCLWCLDLHRTDRDPAWPTLMAQLCPGGGTVVTGPPAGGAELDPALAQLVAGSVALLATQLLAGAHPPPGVSVEVSLPWPRMDHRRWTSHPRCLRHLGASSPGHDAA